MTQILDFFDSKPEQSRLSYHTYLRIVKGPELLKVKARSPATVLWYKGDRLPNAGSERNEMQW